MKYRNDITSKFVKSILYYNPDTGMFIFKENNLIAGTKAKDNKNEYIRISIKGKCYLAHRIAWLYIYGKWPVGDLDHINTIKYDNRIKNLREANQSNNQANVGIRIDNKTGYKGVGFHNQTKKYRARIVKNGKRFELGKFDTPKEAYEAYKQAAIQLQGIYARV